MKNLNACQCEPKHLQRAKNFTFFTPFESFFRLALPRYSEHRGVSFAVDVPCASPDNRDAVLNDGAGQFLRGYSAGETMQLMEFSKGRNAALSVTVAPKSVDAFMAEFRNVKAA